MKRSIGARTIVYPAPVFVVGTYDGLGKPNAMTSAWSGICCSKPPCVSVALRKATYTYGNIIANKAYTISIPSQEYIKEADFFGVVSGRDTDKFKESGLTPVKSELVNAPYVGEFPFVLECELFQTIELGLHTMFVGEIKDVKVEDSAMGGDGTPDISKINPFFFSPEDGTYYGIGLYLAKAFNIGKTLKK